MNGIFDNGGLCQNCQAPLGIPDGSGFVSCGYCGSTWTITRYVNSYPRSVVNYAGNGWTWENSGSSSIVGYSYTPPEVVKKPSGRKWFK